MLRKLCIALLTLASTDLLAQSFFPIITTVSESSDAAEITVVGSGFGAAAPTVKLAAARLSIVSSNNSTIVAKLPVNTAPGSYLLTVENGQTHLPGIFEATLGAQGIQGAAGPAGAQGPQGPMGLPGPQGLSGPAGAVGPAGPKGASGAAGAIGPAGPIGASGAAGAQGVAGPAGPMGATGAAGATGSIGPVGSQGPAGPTGPTGATGPQGAAAPALSHVILVPAVGFGLTYQEDNGTNLLAALSSITDASAHSPYVVQLDAGIYTVDTLNIPAYVSLRGASAGSTTLEGGTLSDLGTAPDSFTITLNSHSTLANLTLSERVNINVSDGTLPVIVLENVQGGPNLNFVYSANLRITIANSSLGNVQALNTHELTSTFVLIVSSQIGQFTGGLFVSKGSARIVSGMHCISSYNNTNYNLFSPDCSMAATTTP